MTRRRLALLAFVTFDLLLVALVAGLFLIRSELARQEQDAELGIARFEEPSALQDFSLVDQHGQVFSRQDLLGRWQFVFFGFTSCPDVCPFAMQALENFYRDLAGTELEKQTGVVMVSVDPIRDTPDVLNSYLQDFHQDFVGLTGDYAQIAELAEQLYVAFAGPQHHTGNHADDYQVPHSDTIAVLDPAGRYRGMIHAPHNAARLQQAYLAFMEE